jgi:hypothetical protein
MLLYERSKEEPDHNPSGKVLQFGQRLMSDAGYLERLRVEPTDPGRVLILEEEARG